MGVRTANTINTTVIRDLENQHHSCTHDEYRKNWLSRFLTDRRKKADVGATPTGEVALPVLPPATAPRALAPLRIFVYTHNASKMTLQQYPPQQRERKREREKTVISSSEQTERNENKGQRAHKKNEKMKKIKTFISTT